MSLRSPICVVVGHVDHGKSSLLDYIRNTNIVASEAGAITQAIGASIIPISVIKEKCGELAQKLNVKFTIPGLLFIDTPGHAAFTSLRKRGGSLADIAILVVDIEEGFKPQTVESVKILIEHKTPFVIAVNKIDTLRGYRTCAQTGIKSVLGNLAKHDAEFINRFETKMYEIVEQVYKHGMKAERFDRVTDFSQEIGLVPISAKIGDGMPELLMVLSALTQKYMEKRLTISEDTRGVGTVLEVKEQKGLGSTMDVIIYDGSLKVNDTIVIGDFDQPIVTKVRGLFVPSSLKDMRDAKGKFDSIKQVFAATGVRINAPGLDSAKSGMPLRVATPQTLEDVKALIMDEVSETSIELDDEGVLVKADTLGGLEALVSLLRGGGVPIAGATVGEISKKDITQAQAFGENKSLFGVILGFNIKMPEGITESGVKVITAPVIYEILDKYAEYKLEVEARERVELLTDLPKLTKIHYLEGCTFRQSNPAVFGVEVLAGELTQHMILMRKDGSKVGVVKSLQEQAKGISKADCGMKVALSMESVTCGRQVLEGDIYFTQVGEQDFLKMKDLKDLLTPQQKDILREIAEIMRRENPLWGMG
jgi:translation initiation factor 5B